jgi:hypothetical protein
VLLRELRERGYTGGYTMLKALVAALKPKKAAAPIVRFETEPGEQMQVDWAVIRRGSNRLSVFVATLGWSRAGYVEFVSDERVETLIEAHENAFLAFGGTARGAVRQYAHGDPAAARLRPGVAAPGAHHDRLASRFPPHASCRTECPPAGRVWMFGCDTLEGGDEWFCLMSTPVTELPRNRPWP